MDSREQTVFSVVTKQGRKKEKKDSELKFRVSPTDVYLLDQVAKDLGQVSRSHAFRWLLEHYPDLKKAESLTGSFKLWRKYETEIEQAIGS